MGEREVTALFAILLDLSCFVSSPTRIQRLDFDRSASDESILTESKSVYLIHPSRMLMPRKYGDTKHRRSPITTVHRYTDVALESRAHIGAVERRATSSVFLARLSVAFHMSEELELQSRCWDRVDAAERECPTTTCVQQRLLAG